MKWLKGGHEVFVVVDVYPDIEPHPWLDVYPDIEPHPWLDVYPDIEPHPWLASDEIFDLERYWDGMQWTMEAKDALTWERYDTALGVANVVAMTAEVKGRICVKRARLETTIEMLGECE